MFSRKRSGGMFQKGVTNDGGRLPAPRGRGKVYFGRHGVRWRRAAPLNPKPYFCGLKTT